jgi:hypothetical protein
MTKKGSLYCASDKAFMDALCQQKMSKSALEDLFLSRGIIRSSKLDKEISANHFSRFSHDYFDHKFISDKVSIGSVKDRNKSFFIQSISKSNAEDAVKKLVDVRKNIDNSIDFSVRGKSIVIDISYTYYDHNKPEFRQAITKASQVVIDFSNEATTIRYPDDEYLSEVSDQLLAEIGRVEGKAIDIERINLRNIDDVNLKTKFFEDLMSNMEGMVFSDVSDVSVYNPATGDGKEDFGVNIKKASLNGEGVLKSGELRQFCKKGFFVYKITWLMKEAEVENSGIFRFSAQFNDPEYCNDFSYSCRGVKKYLDPVRHAKQFSGLIDIDDLRMNRKLELAARNSKFTLVSNNHNSGIEAPQKSAVEVVIDE